MAETKSIRNRALTALVLIVLLILLIVFLNSAATLIITKYFPNFLSYITYIGEGLRVLLGIVGSYMVYRVLLSLVSFEETKRREIGNLEVIKLILKILFYIAVLAIVLLTFGPSLGLSVTSLLAGSAIGGIIIGLAVQTIATSLLSGFIVSSSKTLVPGEALIVHSTIWGDLVCKVLVINPLFTEVLTQNGNRMRLPNTVLLNSTFMKLRKDTSYNYPILASITPDVPLSEFDKRLNLALKSKFTKIKRDVPLVYVASRNSDSIKYTIILSFENFAEVNSLTDVANKVFDDVYREVKDKPTDQKKGKN